MYFSFLFFFLFFAKRNYDIKQINGTKENDENFEHVAMKQLTTSAKKEIHIAAVRQLPNGRNSEFVDKDPSFPNPTSPSEPSTPIQIKIPGFLII